MWLENSYHVATLDNDQALVESLGAGLSRSGSVVVVEALRREDVAKVAALARLRLSDEELDTFTSQLAQILEHANDIAALSLEDVAPTAHPFDLINVVREDVIQPCLSRDEVLAMAPDAEDGRFAVPRIMGEAP